MRLRVGTLQQVVLRLRVMIYRKHVQHESPKNFQLDLFTPTMGSSSTTPSRPTCRCRCWRSTRSSAAAKPRRRPSPNSRASSRDGRCRRHRLRIQSPFLVENCPVMGPTSTGSAKVLMRCLGARFREAHREELRLDEVDGDARGKRRCMSSIPPALRCDPVVDDLLNR
jgi:hypothetical protein